MATINSIHSRQTFDSRVNPTVEVDCHLSNGVWARAAVPSDASTALELRDGGSEYLGKSVAAIQGGNGGMEDERDEADRADPKDDEPTEWIHIGNQILQSIWLMISRDGYKLIE